MSDSFYPFIGAFMWISILFMLSTFLRSRVRMMQKALIPAALTAGVVGFVLMNVGLLGMPTSSGWKTIPPATFGTLVYHLFAFGFVGIGLMSSAASKNSDSGATEGKRGRAWMRVLRSGALWMALMYSLLYAVQGLTGKTIFELFNALSGQNIFAGLGYLVAPGFAQNPGAAQAFGLAWEDGYGIQDAGQVGIAFGAMGFLVAVVIGIPLANWGIRRGMASDRNVGNLPRELLVGMYGKGEAKPDTNTVTHPANIDNLAFHLGLMGAVYSIGYMFAILWSATFSGGLGALGFALLYTWGMLAGIIIRSVLAKTGRSHIIDQGTVRRITGTTVDYMIAAAFMGITVTVLSNIFIPFILTVAVAGVLTFFVVMWYARRLPEYGFERGLAIFGCYTGTVASGLLLLRIVDPDFRSPAASELAVMNVLILPLVQLVYINMAFVPASGSIMLPVFLGYLVIIPIALRLLGFGKVRRHAAEDADVRIG